LRHKEGDIVITVQGTPFEIGYQYGEEAKDLIKRNIRDLIAKHKWFPDFYIFWAKGYC
jgi:hypothetical protein